MVSRISRYRDQTTFAFRHLSVEPIIFLVYLGWVFGNTLQSPGLYRRVCQIYYGDDSKVNCYLISNPDVEDKVQQHAAEWTIYQVLSYLIPAIFADIILGSYGDRYGRKTIILLGLGGLALAEFGFLLTLSNSVASPYWTTLIFNAVAGMTGFITMIPVSCNAYLTDTTSDTDLLTIRSGVFTVFQTLASIIGAFAAAGLSNSISIPVAIDIELFLFLLAFGFTLWKIPQKPGLREIERKTQVRAIRPVGEEPTKRSPTIGRRICNFFRHLGGLLKSGFDIYRKPREGFRRAYMFITAFVLMLSFTTAMETRTSGLINTYVFRRTDSNSLGWTAKELGLWNGSGYSLLLVGTLSGLLIFKKILKLRETTIILIGLSSSCLRTLLIACSLSDWMMYLANVVGLFSGLAQPAVVSFIAQIIPPNEIGRVFSLFGIGADVAMILTTAIYANIYRATVPWSPGFLFYLLAALQLIAILAMLWVHIRSKSEGIERAKAEKKVTSVQTAISRIGEEAPHMGNGGAHNGLGKKNSSKQKMGSKKISIIQHAEQLNQRAESALWESTEDLRSSRAGGVNFY